MQTWMITGCSSGLGRGIAKAALQQGDCVAATARDPKALDSLVQLAPDRVLPLRLDLNDRDSMEQAVEAACRQFGAVDILVNNAGHGYRAAIEESADEAVQELFQTNFFGPMELIRLILPRMRKRRTGLIINVTSIGAVRGALGNGYYSAAKGALELASEALAREVRHLGIRVMLVEPGAFRTGFYGARLGSSAAGIPDYDEIAARYRKGPQTDLHNQPGDPERGGALIVETALRQDAPFRLLLGSDAVRAAEDTLQNRLREVQNWAPVSRRSDYPT